MGTATKQFQICVVGGGPAGATVALSLRQQGHTVHLYEAYPHPLHLEKNSSKSYVISLSQRGQDGLERATGVRPNDVMDGVLTGNWARHPSLKLLQRPEKAFIVPRQKLTAQLLQKAEDAGVQIRFEHRLVDIDFERRVASFDNVTSGAVETKSVQQSYDLLVGADGSKSAVRTLLDQNNGIAKDFSVTRIEKDSMEYQVAVLSETRLNTDQLPQDTVHVWNSKEYNAICLAFPIADERSTLFATVFPEGKLDEFKATGYDDPLGALFPDLEPSQRQALTKQFAAGGAANGGLCVWAVQKRVSF